jgi:hypothetical protein
MKDAVAHCRQRKGPALVHAKVIRPYSHSLSDDERLYKTKAEREEEASRIRSRSSAPGSRRRGSRPRPTSPRLRLTSIAK